MSPVHSCAKHLQGHRGARGQAPENTLPSFECALDACVESIETDLFLTADQVPVLCHDPVLSPTLCRLPADASAKLPTLWCRPLALLTLPELRRYLFDVNPAPARFPHQQALVPPMSAAFSAERGLAPYALPTLEEFFAFVELYAGPVGEKLGKSAQQRAAAARLIFDLEIKAFPFREALHRVSVEKLEEIVLAQAEQAKVRPRIVIRSFDHRVLGRLRRSTHDLALGVLLAETTLLDPVRLLHEMGVTLFCPQYEFLPPEQIHTLRASGFAVLPWTVNEVADWQTLSAWGVTGITTDYPQKLRNFWNDLKKE